MCYACEHPLNASTYEKSVWIQEYRQWAQCSEAEAQSIDDVEEIEPETAEEIEEVFQLTMAERLAEYREKKKKVLDSFEIIRQHPLEGVLPDLYRDIETGRTFDLEENEYHEYPHIGWALL